MKKAVVFWALCWIYTCIFCFAQDKNIQKIVSLGPSVTENLYLLGAGENIIADTVYCQRPEQAKNKAKVGSITTVDIEKIVSLRPDIVIATSLTSPAQVTKMRDMGLNVEVIQYAKNFSGLEKQFQKLAEITGKKEYADDILKKSRVRIEIIRKKAETFRKKRVFIQIGANPLFSATKDSFINDFIEFAGGINTAAESKTGIYSREKVIKDNPEVIFIVTMGISGESEKKAWQKYKTIDAVKNGKIYMVDSYKVCSPTPYSFAEVLNEISLCLQEGFNE